MADRVLLIMARRDGRWIAGALNLIGDDCLYGRNWGCVEDVPFLHFELCYYQAIEWAIGRGLARVEAGAQGQHKIARGYLPGPSIPPTTSPTRPCAGRWPLPRPGARPRPGRRARASSTPSPRSGATTP